MTVTSKRVGEVLSSLEPKKEGIPDEKSERGSPVSGSTSKKSSSTASKMRKESAPLKLERGSSRRSRSSRSIGSVSSDGSQSSPFTSSPQSFASPSTTSRSGRRKKKHTFESIQESVARPPLQEEEDQEGEEKGCEVEARRNLPGKKIHKGQSERMQRTCSVSMVTDSPTKSRSNKKLVRSHSVSSFDDSHSSSKKSSRKSSKKQKPATTKEEDNNTENNNETPAQCARRKFASATDSPSTSKKAESSRSIAPDSPKKERKKSSSKPSSPSSSKSKSLSSSKSKLKKDESGDNTTGQLDISSRSKLKKDESGDNSSGQLDIATAVSSKKNRQEQKSSLVKDMAAVVSSRKKQQENKSSLVHDINTVVSSRKKEQEQKQEQKSSLVRSLREKFSEKGSRDEKSSTEKASAVVDSKSKSDPGKSGSKDETSSRRKPKLVDPKEAAAADTATAAKSKTSSKEDKDLPKQKSSRKTTSASTEKHRSSPSRKSSSTEKEERRHHRSSRGVKKFSSTEDWLQRVDAQIEDSGGENASKNNVEDNSENASHSSRGISDELIQVLARRSIRYDHMLSLTAATTLAKTSENMATGPYGGSQGDEDEDDNSVSSSASKGASAELLRLFSRRTSANDATSKIPFSIGGSRIPRRNSDGLTPELRRKLSDRSLGDSESSDILAGKGNATDTELEWGAVAPPRLPDELLASLQKSRSTDDWLLEENEYSNLSSSSPLVTEGGSSDDKKSPESSESAGGDTSKDDVRRKSYTRNESGRLLEVISDSESEPDLLDDAGKHPNLQTTQSLERKEVLSTGPAHRRASWSTDEMVARRGLIMGKDKALPQSRRSSVSSLVVAGDAHPGRILISASSFRRSSLLKGKKEADGQGDTDMLSESKVFLRLRQDSISSDNSAGDAGIIKISTTFTRRASTDHTATIAAVAGFPDQDMLSEAKAFDRSRRDTMTSSSVGNVDADPIRRVVRRTSIEALPDPDMMSEVKAFERSRRDSMTSASVGNVDAGPIRRVIRRKSSDALPDPDMLSEAKAFERSRRDSMTSAPGGEVGAGPVRRVIRRKSSDALPDPDMLSEAKAFVRSCHDSMTSAPGGKVGAGPVRMVIRRKSSDALPDPVMLSEVRPDFTASAPTDGGCDDLDKSGHDRFSVPGGHLMPKADAGLQLETRAVTDGETNSKADAGAPPAGNSEFTNIPIPKRQLLFPSSSGRNIAMEEVGGVNKSLLIKSVDGGEKTKSSDGSSRSRTKGGDGSSRSRTNGGDINDPGTSGRIKVRRRLSSRRSKPEEIEQARKGIELLEAKESMSSSNHSGKSSRSRSGRVREAAANTSTSRDIVYRPSPFKMASESQAKLASSQNGANSSSTVGTDIVYRPSPWNMASQSEAKLASSSSKATLKESWGRGVLRNGSKTSKITLPPINETEVVADPSAPAAKFGVKLKPRSKSRTKSSTQGPSQEGKGGISSSLLIKAKLNLATDNSLFASPPTSSKREAKRVVPVRQLSSDGCLPQVPELSSPEATDKAVVDGAVPKVAAPKRVLDRVKQFESLSGPKKPVPETVWKRNRGRVGGGVFTSAPKPSKPGRQVIYTLESGGLGGRKVWRRKSFSGANSDELSPTKKRRSSSMSHVSQAKIRAEFVAKHDAIHKMTQKFAAIRIQACVRGMLERLSRRVPFTTLISFKPKKTKKESSKRGGTRQTMSLAAETSLRPDFVREHGTLLEKLKQKKALLIQTFVRGKMQLLRYRVMVLENKLATIRGEKKSEVTKLRKKSYRAIKKLEHKRLKEKNKVEKEQEELAERAQIALKLQEQLKRENRKISDQNDKLKYFIEKLKTVNDQYEKRVALHNKNCVTLSLHVKKIEEKKKRLESTESRLKALVRRRKEAVLNTLRMSKWETKHGKGFELVSRQIISKMDQRCGDPALVEMLKLIKAGTYVEPEDESEEEYYVHDDSEKSLRQETAAGDEGAAGDDLPAEKLRDDSPAEKLRDDSPADKVRDDSPADKVRDDSPADTMRDDLKADTVRDDLPADTVRDDLPADTVRDDLPADTVRDDLPADTVREETVRYDIPAETVRHDSPAEKVRYDSPAEKMRDDSLAEKMRDDSPAKVREETVRDDLPAEKVRDDCPAEKVRDDSPAEKVRDDSPAEKVRDDSPVEKVRDDSPAETVRDDCPAETVRDDCPAKMRDETVRDDSPAEKVRDDSPAKMRDETVRDDSPAENVREETVQDDTLAENVQEETMQNDIQAEKVRDDDSPAEKVRDDSPAEKVRDYKPATTVPSDTRTVPDDMPIMVQGDVPEMTAPGDVLEMTVSNDMQETTVFDDMPVITFGDDLPVIMVQDFIPATTVVDDRPTMTLDEKPAMMVDDKPAMTVPDEMLANTAQSYKPVHTATGDIPQKTVQDDLDFTIGEYLPIKIMQVKMSATSRYDIPPKSSHDNLPITTPSLTVQAGEPISMVQDDEPMTKVQEDKSLMKAQDDEPIAKVQDDAQIATVQDEDNSHIATEGDDMTFEDDEVALEDHGRGDTDGPRRTRVEDDLPPITSVSTMSDEMAVEKPLNEPEPLRSEKFVNVDVIPDEGSILEEEIVFDEETVVEEATVMEEATIMEETVVGEETILEEDIVVEEEDDTIVEEEGEEVEEMEVEADVPTEKGAVGGEGGFLLELCNYEEDDASDISDVSELDDPYFDENGMHVYVDEIEEDEELYEKSKALLEGRFIDDTPSRCKSAATQVTYDDEEEDEEERTMEEEAEEKGSLMEYVDEEDEEYEYEIVEDDDEETEDYDDGEEDNYTCLSSVYEARSILM